MLKKEDNNFLKELKKELEATHNKVQIYRTETEMRYSVLNDASFPTKASKYWQCVREQDVFYTNLREESYAYRKLLVEIQKIERAIKNEQDDLEIELLEIGLEQKLWEKEERERMGKDRVREIEHWSRLKKELDDGSFDTKNVNVHQKESLKLQLQERAKNLTPGSSQGEALNVIGPLKTIDPEFRNQLEAQERIALEANKRQALNGKNN
jgi:Xaa-Pro aminopeptidase|tara:strand:+ start:2064 stop:2693 length:630 start_codon:yes stop_codon:yes gene_type:complete